MSGIGESRPTAAGLATGLALAALLALGAQGAQRAERDRFDHLEHRGLFPVCEGCHRAEPDGRLTMPAASSCAECHDGERERRVVWTPAAARPANLRFDHADHARVAREKRDTTVACTGCHVPAGQPFMDVRRAVVARCLDCHDTAGDHLVDAPCATCHVRLADARDVPAEEIAEWPEPADHEDARFAFEHGRAAQADVARCETCHARESCSACHVNAPEVPAIRAMARDPRVAALVARRAPEYPLPESHRAGDWWESHGGQARSDVGRCATCHTRTSCETCHAPPTPDAVRALPVAPTRDAGQERGPGVRLERRPPPSHTSGFLEDHRAAAAAGAPSCATCHPPAECTSCHTGSEARARRDAGAYHPPNFAQRHAALAFGAATECASCHNPVAFCRDCHAARGLETRGRTDLGFHDRTPAWIFGHGQAARQGLETCATCHAQRDCQSCHSAVGGRRVNPHGPDFDGHRLRKKNPELCLRCHFPSILEP